MCTCRCVCFVVSVAIAVTEFFFKNGESNVVLLGFVEVLLVSFMDVIPQFS